MTTYTDRMTIARMLNGKRKQAALKLAQMDGVPYGIWPLLKQGLFGTAAALLIEEIGQDANMLADMLWEG